LAGAYNIHDDLSSKDTAMSGQSELHALIRSCIADDRTAQKSLYDKYAPAAYAVIKRYEYNEHIAVEILNDAFFKVFTKLSQYSFQGAFEGWIRRIVINTITDSLRKNIRHNQAIKGELQENDATVHSDSVSQLSYKELLNLVHALPDTQKAVFNLYVFEDLPHKEIAALLSINENNSRWYLNDARKRLKEKINAMN
jgi:RNA polymerase sigma factor (sigma-70 family)